MSKEVTWQISLKRVFVTLEIDAVAYVGRCHNIIYEKKRGQTDFFNDYLFYSTEDRSKVNLYYVAVVSSFLNYLGNGSLRSITHL